MQAEILGERYELLTRVGSGGMAEVYKAHDKILDRIVAIKILHTQLAVDEEFVKRFHREAQGAAKLSHPNIVNIYDVGQIKDKHYIVMEYVDGITLKDLIKERGSLLIEESLRIAGEIASALVNAHAHHLVHCDIKPHNILIMQDGRVKVADFGIARVVTSSTITYSGNVVGSVHYISPEQAKGIKITPKSDVYSLGVVLYEMLSGKLPFTGENPVSVALKHLQEKPEPLTNINPLIPPLVEQIVERAMEKDSSQRLDSSQFIEAISAVGEKLFPNMQFSHMTYAGTNLSEEEMQKEKKQPKKKIVWKKLSILVLALLVVGFFIGAFLSYGKFWSTKEVVVPNVVGKTLVVAKEILEHDDLQVRVTEVFDSTVPKGDVVSQMPEANAIVKSQRMITISISKGAEEVVMPNIVGLRRQMAEDKLKTTGLLVGVVQDEYSDTIEAGMILSQDPVVGSKIMKGNPVSFTLSKGKKIKEIRLPDFTGGTLDAAKASVESLHLKMGEVKKVQSRKPEGTIVKQNPPPNSTVLEGLSVDFEVATKRRVNRNTGMERPQASVNEGEKR